MMDFFKRFQILVLVAVAAFATVVSVSAGETPSEKKKRIKNYDGIRVQCPGVMVKAPDGSWTCQVS